MSSSDNHDTIRGEAANLNIFRATDTATAKVALEQFLKADERELLGPCAVQATLISDDHATVQVEAQVVITSNRLVLWSSRGDGENDLVVPGACIELHAISENSVYMQISVGEESSLELTIEPQEKDDALEVCQRLFETVSELIRLHPIDPNDMDDHGVMGMMASMMGGAFVGQERIGDHMEGEDDDMIVASSSSKDLGASQEEREAMLRRLDEILVVPPDLEQSSDVEGQFDDADDDNDEDELL